MIYPLCRFLVYCFFKLGFKLKVEGRSELPVNSPCIIAANHISNFDPLVIRVSSPISTYSLAKEELFKYKIFNFFLSIFQVIPLKRGSSDLKAIKTALAILKDKPLVIFPQGTRTVELDNFKRGVGFLCKKAKVPVVAARIYGTDKIMPKGVMFPRPGQIKVVFTRVKNIDYADTAEKISADIMETIKSI